MEPKQKKSKTGAFTIVIMLFVVIGILSTSFINNVQDDKKKKPWVVPDKSKAMKSPVKSDNTTLAKGKELFTKHCKSCHGATGKGDGPKSKELDTPTGDFTDKSFQTQTEGEIFYKAKEGRDDMPSFKKKLPDDEDIWTIVNYVRSISGAK
jgi:mono/diheme cytochrome c family protein